MMDAIPAIVEVSSRRNMTVREHILWTKRLTCIVTLKLKSNREYPINEEGRLFLVIDMLVMIASQLDVIV